MTTRRAFTAASAGVYATLSILRFPADAAEFTYKLGHEDPPAFSATTRIAQAVEKIKDDSGGRLEIQVFDNNQLGGGAQMLSQVRLGAIQFVRIGLIEIAGVVPACGMEFMPYIYTSYKEAFEARDGAFGAYLRGALSKIGVYAFERMWEYGFRQIYNNARPIASPDDLKGLKVRTAPGNVPVAFFKALGATPTPMNINELYTAFQTHLVDGSEGSLTQILGRKFYEIVKYLSITNHAATGSLVLANAAAWQQLPKNLRDITDRNFNAAALAGREDMLKEQAATEASLKDKGMIGNRADVGAFKAAVRRAGLYAQWRDLYGPDAWSALEKSVGPLV